MERLRQDSNLRHLVPEIGRASVPGARGSVGPVERLRQDSNLRHLVPETSALSPELRRPAAGASPRAAKTTGRYPREGNRGPPIRWGGESRPALHHRRRGAHRARRRRSAHPARRRPDRGDGGASAAEGARRLRHQRGAPARRRRRWSTGAPTRARSASCSPRDCVRRQGISAVEVAGPGFLNVTVEAGAQGEVAADVVAAGAAYGRNETLAGHPDQRGVHLRQPDRAACTWATPGGRWWATRSRGCWTRRAPT